MTTEQFKIPEGNLAAPYDPTHSLSYTNNPYYYQTEESMDRFEKYFWEAQRATEEKGSWKSNFRQIIKDALENENITTEHHQKLMDDYRFYNSAELEAIQARGEEAARKKEREMFDWASGSNKTPISLAQGGSLDEHEIMDELLASYGGNEMRAYTPGPFEKQEQAIESFLSGIGQFAGEKEIPFLKALADPAYARNVAGNLSFGTEMTPGVGDVQAIREGAFMMGEDQPLMGSLFIGGSLIGLPSSKLKQMLKKAEQKLEKARTMEYHGQSHMKETNAPKDRRLGEKLYDRSQTDIAKHKTEIAEINEALKQGELKSVPDSGAKKPEPDMFDRLAEKHPGFRKMLEEGRKDPGRAPYIKEVLKKTIVPPLRRRTKMSLKLEDMEGLSPLFRNLFQEDLQLAKAAKIKAKSKVKQPFAVPDYQMKEIKKVLIPPLSKTGRKAAAKTPEPKGIINATPETRKLYDDLQRGWKKELTPEHKQLRKEMTEQRKQVHKAFEEADLEERNEFVQLMLDMKNKKPK